MSRYTVWSVGRDGNVEDLFSFDDPAFALALAREAERLNCLESSTRSIGITDNESPESGDVSDKLAEKLEEGR